MILPDDHAISYSKMSQALGSVLHKGFAELLDGLKHPETFVAEISTTEDAPPVTADDVMRFLDVVDSVSLAVDFGPIGGAVGQASTDVSRIDRPSMTVEGLGGILKELKELKPHVEIGVKVKW
jgi:hypothetical protein